MRNSPFFTVKDRSIVRISYLSKDQIGRFENSEQEWIYSRGTTNILQQLSYDQSQ